MTLRKSFLAGLSLMLVGMFSIANQANADVVVSDFSSFSFTGTYVQWDNATITSGATDLRVEGFDFGGAWHDLAAPVDATGQGSLFIAFTANAADVANAFNIVMIDGDGTERVFQVAGYAMGANAIEIGLNNFLQDNNPGSTAGLDVSNITTFHLQGTFANGDPGLAQDLTFDKISFVPEPGSLAFLGLGALALVARRRRG